MGRQPSNWQQRVADRREKKSRAGRAGAQAQHALYPRSKFAEWGRMGGNRPNPTLAEILAEKGAAK